MWRKLNGNMIILIMYFFILCFWGGSGSFSLDTPGGCFWTEPWGDGFLYPREHYGTGWCPQFRGNGLICGLWAVYYAPAGARIEVGPFVAACLWEWGHSHSLLFYCQVQPFPLWVSRKVANSLFVYHSFLLKHFVFHSYTKFVSWLL